MTDTRMLMEHLVSELTPNARIVDIDERERDYVVTIAGTTGVTARCEVPRAAADRALADDEARARLALMLKRGADHTVAPVPDGRA